MGAVAKIPVGFVCEGLVRLELSTPNSPPVTTEPGTAVDVLKNGEVKLR